MSGERWTVVTGAADGIGSALVKRLSDLGHHVLAVDKDGDKLQHVLRHNSDLIRGLCVDISDKKTPYLIVEALPTGAKVNYLVHNAALTLVTPFGEITSDIINSMFAVNFTAPLMITQYLRDIFVHGARIIHLGTNMAHRPEYGLLGYCTSKAAFYQLYQTSRLELASRHVLVGSVRTGAVNTESFRLGHQNAIKYGLPIAKLEDRVLEQGMVFEPPEAACFLSYLMLDVSDEEFVKKPEWDAYDKTHWSNWRL